MKTARNSFFEFNQLPKFIDEIIGLKSNEDILDKLFCEFASENNRERHTRTDPDQPYTLLQRGTPTASRSAATRIGAEVLMLTGNLIRLPK